MSLALAALLVLAPSARVAVPAESLPSRARYVATREDGARGLALPSHEAFGWSQRARLLPDGSTEITVVSQPRHARVPGILREARVEARAALVGIEEIPDEVRLLASEILLGVGDDWDASRLVLTWVSVNVRHEDDPGHGESALESLRHRVASCVGRSRLAADLLRSAGVPARTIHGLLATPAHGRDFLLHRFVESWIEGLGWVPSDPGESIHVVDARHVFVAVEDPGYDPESQRGLRLRPAERLSAPLAPAPPSGLRALVVRERPVGASGRERPVGASGRERRVGASGRTAP